MKKKYKFSISVNAFTSDVERNKFKHKVKFSSKIFQMNQAVEPLDRYDDFSELKIDDASYRRSGQAKYGILRDENIHRVNTVILPHQKIAALRFLKELRGFGLLADVVGSGKTYEACVVLSELAVRNRIRSMLIVVPSQVFDTWLEVLEKNFGLGEGVLKQMGKRLVYQEDEYTFADDARIPIYPTIVRTEDFAVWDFDAANYLFDVIVVDEAHNLCQQEGEYAKTMELLSRMMVTKKKANSTYCILLSATPHSGNLDKMFRLWYFIRCQGGNPDDFKIQEDAARTKEYLEEKKYYHDFVCRGASTVMEFINNVKIQEILTNKEYADIVNEMIAKVKKEYFNNKKPDIYSERYRIFQIVDNKLFTDLLKSEQITVINYAMRENPSFEKELQRRIASSYHNGVLRSIMIRQQRNSISRTKEVINVLFYPTTKKIDEKKIKGLRQEDITIDCSNLYGDEAITLLRGGKEEKISIERYLQLYTASYNNEVSKTHAYADFMCGSVLPAFNDMNEDNGIFRKASSQMYYHEQLSSYSGEATNIILPVEYNPNNTLTEKINYTTELLHKHQNERVIVFFDYDNLDLNKIYNEVKEELQKDERIAKRIIECDDVPDNVIKKFDLSPDAILLVNSAAFTEGANMQSCSIIINFQVTPDPLAMDQRIGRIFRLGQASDVKIYSLAYMNDLEGYVLMYFLRIGLLGLNSGDATIIAGSNNERMVAVRCPACKNVHLLTKEEYDFKKGRDELYCNETSLCRLSNKKGTMMTEILVYDFKCSKCGAMFTRTINEGGYRCIATTNNERGIMCSTGEKADRSYKCRKICAVSHCHRFRFGEMKDKCTALKSYDEALRQGRKITDTDLLIRCSRCSVKEDCKARGCIINESINKCRQCSNATCRPKPHVLHFNEQWEAECPKCNDHSRGMIRPIIARTFATYIYALWNFEHDHGQSFVNKLLEESTKVEEIKNILGMDEASEDRL